MCYLGEEEKKVIVNNCSVQTLRNATLVSLDVCTDLHVDLFGTCHEIRNFVDTMP